ncbi:MAG: hypothetical protein OEQ18_02125 [Gammaproteobacteria bacterium]|nr:hypothetical protein [Gammaproteobacteria bacterium]
MAQRHMIFEEAVMRFAGVTEIPSFDNPYPVTDARKPKGLGHACGGKKIEGCQSWFQAHAPKRVTEGKMIHMVVTEHDLAEHMCRICQEGKRRG